MGQLAEEYRLEGISPKAYEHPADRAATAALASIPHLDTVVRKLIELGYERALRQALLGASVRLGDRIVGGDYQRRGEPVQARVEAGEAAAHYGERFAGFFRDAGESAQQAMDQLGEWLKREGAERSSR